MEIKTTKDLTNRIEHIRQKRRDVFKEKLDKIKE